MSFPETVQGQRKQAVLVLELWLVQERVEQLHLVVIHLKVLWCAKERHLCRAHIVDVAVLVVVSD